MVNAKVLLNDEYTECILKKQDVKNIPFYHIEDLDELSKSYPNFNNWLTDTCFDRQAYACYKDNFLIGYLIFKIFHTDHYGLNKTKKTLKISSFFVTEKWRNLGVGSLLLNRCIVNEDFDQIYVTITKDKEKVINFFEHHNDFKQIAKKNKRDICEVVLSRKKVYSSISYS